MSAMPRSTVSPSLERLRALSRSLSPSAAPVSAVRRAALERLFELGLPTQRDEPWKYTSLRRFDARELALPDRVSAADALAALTVLPVEWPRIVFVNGHFAQHASSIPVAGAGLSIRSLAGLIREAPIEAARLLDGGEPSPSGRFELANRAFVGDGVVIELDADAETPQPLYIVCASMGSGGPMLSCPRIIVRAGSGSRCTLIEHHVSSGGSEDVTLPVTQLQIGDGAQVEHYRLREEGRQVVHLATNEATLGRDAGYVSHTLSVGGALARLDLAVRLQGTGSRTVLNGVFLADGSGHVDTHSRIDHAAPLTTSSQDYRGLADGKGRGVFNGRVVVHPDAQKVDARQSNRNLLLSATAEIDTRPELEIHADDVRCSHGATTGQLDDTALFYLRSRGIAEDEARGLLTLAFVESVLGGMTLQPVHDHVSRIFRRHFLRDGKEPT